MAVLTRSEVMRPLSVRFWMRAVFVAPELRQAMLMLLCCEGPLKKRRRLGRNFRVIVVIRTVMKKSFSVQRPSWRQN
jgi:hypothetical protein